MIFKRNERSVRVLFRDWLSVKQAKRKRAGSVNEYSGQIFFDAIDRYLWPKREKLSREVFSIEVGAPLRGHVEDTRRQYISKLR